MIDLLKESLKKTVSFIKKVDPINGTFSKSSGLSWERDNEILFDDIEHLVESAERQELSESDQFKILSRGFLKNETMARLKQKGGKYQELSRQYRGITDKQSTQKKVTRETCLSKYQLHIPEMLKTFQSLLFETLLAYSDQYKEPIFFYGTYAFIKFYQNKTKDAHALAPTHDELATNDIDCIVKNQEIVLIVFQTLVYFAQNYVFSFDSDLEIAIREISVSSGKYGALSSFKLKYECYGDECSNSCLHKHCLYTGVILDCLSQETPKYEIGQVRSGPYCQYQGLLCYVACLIDKFYNITEKPLSKKQIQEGREKIVKVLNIIASDSLLRSSLALEKAEEIISTVFNEEIFKTPLAKTKFLEYITSPSRLIF